MNAECAVLCSLTQASLLEMQRQAWNLELEHGSNRGRRKLLRTPLQALGWVEESFTLKKLSHCRRMWGLLIRFFPGSRIKGSLDSFQGQQDILEGGTRNQGRKALQCGSPRKVLELVEKWRNEVQVGSLSIELKSRPGSYSKLSQTTKIIGELAIIGPLVIHHELPPGGKSGLGIEDRTFMITFYPETLILCRTRNAEGITGPEQTRRCKMPLRNFESQETVRYVRFWLFLMAEVGFLGLQYPKMPPNSNPVDL